MSLGAIILGLINILIVVAVLILIGYIILWVLGPLLGFPVPEAVQKIYIAIVALIALYMLVALLLGVPSIHILRGDANSAKTFVESNHGEETASRSNPWLDHELDPRLRFRRAG